MKYITPVIILFSALIVGCRPELPVTSTITVDMESATLPVTKELYGLSMNEATRKDESGLHAEYIQNRNFDRTDALPGWHTLSPNTYLQRSTVRPVSADNPHSLMVSVSATDPNYRGGVIAEGYRGIPLVRGEKYHLSFFMRTATSVTPVPIQIALEDSLRSRPISDVFVASPTYEWTRYTHTFIATEDEPNAALTFSINSTSFFWLDLVSLTPDKTWKNRPNGFRPDVMEKIAALSPAFIRYKGTVNDEGFSDFEQMCKDLNTEAIYAIDSSRLIEKHVFASEAFFISDTSLFQSDYAPTSPGLWIEGMAVTDSKSRGTLGAAVAGACFLIRAESASRLISRIAFTPIASSIDSDSPYPPLILFSNSEAVISPSYYLLQMFAHNQGDVVIKTEVNTYARPQIVPGLPPDSPVVDESLPPLPSIVSNATLDKNTHTLLLKVVNTTLHDEITEIIIRGASANSHATIVQLKGSPEWRNTFESPNMVIPSEETISFPIGRNITYKFPPNSVTILKLQL